MPKRDLRHRPADRLHPLDEQGDLHRALHRGIISGGTFSMLGATFDIAYFASGVCGLLMLIKYRREIFGQIKAATRSNRPKSRGRRLKI